MSSSDDLFIYYRQSKGEVRQFRDGHIANIYERERIVINGLESGLGTDLLAEAKRIDARGLVIEQERGWMNRIELRIALDFLRAGLAVFLYFPNEKEVERLHWSTWRHQFQLFVFAFLYKSLRGRIENRYYPSFAEVVERRMDLLRDEKQMLLPCPLPNLSETNQIPGKGIYLRLDFWNEAITGGSVGHTANVASELNDRFSDGIICLMGARNPMIDDLGIPQIVLPEPTIEESANYRLLAAEQHYRAVLKPLFEYIKPTFIYERLVPGSSVGTYLSQQLGLPHIVEFNGSERDMMKAAGVPLEGDEAIASAEEIVLRKASMVSVISEPVKADALAHGCEEDLILVNPNGANPDVYRPAIKAEKAKLRSEFGLKEEHVVYGFVGSFGFWHGIEQLSQSVPTIASAVPNARFIFIGNGDLHHLITDMVREYQLEDRCKILGSLPHHEAARILRLCDILLSPHAGGIHGKTFFGSPTKVFEYMSMAGAIVASDLEQIGDVLSPAIRCEDLDETTEVRGECAILIRPGNVDDLVNASVYLANHPDIAGKIGQNARKKLEAEYSWKAHVDNLLQFMIDRKAAVIQTEQEQITPVNERGVRDAYKREAQLQWDNDACGSHYAHAKEPLEWYQEVEDYRYRVYAPWMRENDFCEFSKHNGHKVLEVGGGLGTDLVQFAKAGAICTDLDLSLGHLEKAANNFALRGLDGSFIQGDAENMPFATDSFDVVYSNGVIHHTTNMNLAIDEIFRVLKPGGKAIVMVYARHSWQYWGHIILRLGFRGGRLSNQSVGGILSRHVEISQTGARPLVKVMTGGEMRKWLHRFEDVKIYKRQLMSEDLPRYLRFIPVSLLAKFLGWNLLIKAKKPLY